MSDPTTSKRGPGRPVILRVCAVCKNPKKTSLFPPAQTAAVPDRCKACGKLAMEARRTIHSEGLTATTEAKRIRRIAVLERRVEAAEARRMEKLRASPQIEAFKRDMQERAANRESFAKIGAFLQTICVPRCECCFALSAGQDTIGLRYWCSLCGWGIERTGRCLAHPGETFYPGLPQEGFTLPAELLATMKAPSARQEAPAREPDEEEAP